jgi:hypothetical protein
MKFAVSLFFITVISGTILGQSPFFDATDNFMSTYAEGGLIDYKSIRSDQSKLNELVEMIGSFQLEDKPDNEKLAFYINAYNVLVIKQVVDNYPVKSPMDVSGFFDKTGFDVAGQSLTLNQIENDVIRPTFNDARIHFVLVCGAMDCPPIVDFAYVPDKIYDQMEKQTKLALNDDSFIKVKNNAVEFSEIFKWYEQDFLQDYSSILEYINSYRKAPIPQSSSTGFYTYDWSLNEKKKKRLNRISRNRRM